MRIEKSNRKKAHIISHSHWDREWYLPFEKHRYYLIKLLDQLLELLEQDPEYRSFHLDGQTIIIEDYLQIRPEKREKLARLIREGRIHIGPWYILQDEFLTSSEANIRNLLIGHRDAKEYGGLSKLGYFPDSFGNMGQAPQILRQADIDTAVFGRGVKPTGFNNTVGERGYESPYSELHWESPDGSRVMGILFANWYSNGNEIPSDVNDAQQFWDDKLAAAEGYASTPHLLFMNGCDHQPIQTDLSEALRTARELYPDMEFIHSDFDTYRAALKETLPDDLSVIHGELRSQHTDGWGTLVNTSSARVYMKQMNQRGQTLLEKGAEPLATYASLLGLDYPHVQLVHAWKTLMQNHPHDSICGCSVDEVHREMMTRFEKSRQVAEMIIDESVAYIAERIDTSEFANDGSNTLPFVVFNTTGLERSGVVSVELDVLRIYFSEGASIEEIREQVKSIPVGEGIVIDNDGGRWACQTTDLGIQFGYDLPEDRFRQPYFARTIRIEFEAIQVPANGHKAYAFLPSDVSSDNGKGSLLVDERTLENAHLIVHVEANGSLTLTDKESGVTYKDLCVYEDTGDIGNEYMYKQPNGELTLTTKALRAEVFVLSDTSYEGSLEILHHWEIPAEANDLLTQERAELVWFTKRQSARVRQTVPLQIRTIIQLEKNGKGLKVRTEFNNTAKDHRVRVLFPTDLSAGVHYADSVFEVVKRDNRPAPEWTNPSNCHHQQAFVSMQDDKVGLTIANRGLSEYEVLQDGRNTIAITLLRSVGELGDWGLFPTPEAQCIGPHSVEFMIIPHRAGGGEATAYAAAYQFQVPWFTKPTNVHGGPIKAHHSWIAWDASELALSAVKVSEHTGDVIVRWFNWNNREVKLAITTSFTHDRIAISDVLERRRESVDKGDTHIVGPYQIFTLSILPSSIN